MQDRRAAAYAAEFMGTFTLVLFVVWGITSLGSLGYADWAVIGLLHVFVLTMLVYTLGGVSGGHFNPAVTIAMTVARRITPSQAAPYIVAQLLGAIAGAFLVKALLSNEAEAVGYGATVVSNRVFEGSAFSGMIAEGIGAFFLAWAVIAATASEEAKAWAGAVIGMTLGAVVFILGPITGAGVNPARSLGPALAAGKYPDFLVSYVIGPVIGAVLAAIVYSVVVGGAGKKEGSSSAA